MKYKKHDRKSNLQHAQFYNICPNADFICNPKLKQVDTTYFTQNSPQYSRFSRNRLLPKELLNIKRLSVPLSGH